jgi:hypothetical protein
LLSALAILFGFVSHNRWKAKVAKVNQQVAEACAQTEQAKNRQAAQVRDGEAQANVAAARAGADASKERTHVENDVAAPPAGATAVELLDEGSRPAENAGRVTGSAGQDRLL